jgi:hypothetical protein
MDLDQFSRRIRDVAKGVEPGVDAVVRKYAVVANQAVVMATPVDTGRARANWQISIGAPVNDETGSTDAQGQLERNKATIGTHRASSGQELYLQNNVAYIERLNQGWSAQAGAGFVEKALIAAARAIGRVKVLR